jgi:glycosyltransferase involved in cell wall biosynthesis
MRIAILGTRGIPASYGGFETFAEELSLRLVQRGHHVAVYCRQRHSDATYHGVELRYLPTIRHKYFDTIAHTAFSTLHLLLHRVDVVLYCNGANAIFTFAPRLLGMPTAINVDGLERKRKKWNQLAKRWYHLSEWLSTFCATRVVTDAEHIEDYYRDTYGCRSTFIPYGAPIGRVAWNGLLGLQERDYFLYVSRLEPENNALLVREAFEQVQTAHKLALIGDAPYADEYKARLRATNDERIVMPGAVYGDGYHELQSHCLAYIHATEVGGTHPALIEAMGRGALVLYLDTEENAEVAGGAGLPFTHETLPDVLRKILQMPEAEREAWRERARQRVEERYSWEAVTTAYEKLLEEIR